MYTQNICIMTKENSYRELYDCDNYDVHHSKIYLVNNNTVIYAIKKMIINFINNASNEDAMDTYKYSKNTVENNVNHLYTFEYNNYIFEVRVNEILVDKCGTEYDIRIIIEPLLKRSNVKEHVIRYYSKLYDFVCSIVRFLSGEVVFRNENKELL